VDGRALALYIVVLSATGSVLVYRNEINTLVATRKPPFDPKATRLTPQQIREAVQRAYPDWTIATRHPADASGLQPSNACWYARR
jgi:uncharacterized iron-regulated membrane protein